MYLVVLLQVAFEAKKDLKYSKKSILAPPSLVSASSFGNLAKDNYGIG